MTTPRPAADGSYATRATHPSYAGHPARDAAPSYAPRSEQRAAGRRPDRKESEVRRLLDVPHPPVPPDLADRAMARGRRLIRRRRALRTAAWLVLSAAALAALVALIVHWRATQALDATPLLPGG